LVAAAGAAAGAAGAASGAATVVVVVVSAAGSGAGFEHPATTRVEAAIKIAHLPAAIGRTEFMRDLLFIILARGKRYRFGISTQIRNCHNSRHSGPASRWCARTWCSSGGPLHFPVVA
jgi:hypothetical protein